MSNGARIGIFLIDDEPLIRAAVRKLLESWPEFEVVGEAREHVEAVHQIQASGCDLVLLTVSGETDADIKVVGEVARALEPARVLVLAGECARGFHIRAVSFGARGVIPKRTLPEEFRKALKKVHSGEIWLDRMSMTKLVNTALQGYEHATSQTDSPLAVLSDREVEVARLVVKGLTNREVGERLFISETTVRHHLTAIYSKLRISNRFELITYVHQHTLAHP